MAHGAKHGKFIFSAMASLTDNGTSYYILNKNSKTKISHSVYGAIYKGLHVDV
jgi:hypothetical protein